MAKIQENAAAFEVSLQDVAKKSGFSNSQLKAASYSNAHMNLLEARRLAASFGSGLTLNQLFFGPECRPISLEGLDAVGLCLVLSALHKRCLDVKDFTTEPADMQLRTAFGRRAIAGMTQTQLAEILGVSRSSVEGWENRGGIKNVDRLLQLSDLTRLSVDYLVDGGTLSLNPYGMTDKEREMVLAMTACLRTA